MKENNYTVYKHTSPSGKTYIGITSKNPIERWRNGRGYEHNKHFYSAILKYGWDNIKHEILFTDLSKEEAEQKEIELIASHRSNNHEFGYNVENGGNSIGKMSEETKEKLSLAHRGKTYKKRRNHTEEEKRAISNTLKGRVSPMKDKHWSIEQRARVGTPIICLETKETFYSIKEAERQTGISKTSIMRCLKRENYKTKGFSFVYKAH